MATTVNIARQTILVAERNFDFQDLPHDTAVPLIYIRPGTQILGGFVEVTTIWGPSGVTAATLAVGDDSAANTGSRYASNINLKNAGVSSLTAPVANGVVPSNGAITARASYTGGTPTSGKGRIVVWYIESGVRQTELNPYMG